MGVDLAHAFKATPGEQAGGVELHEMVGHLVETAGVRR